MKDFHRNKSELLAAYADRTLETATAAGVSDHLSGCAPCRAELQDWRALYRALARLPRPVPAAGLQDRILFAIAQEAALQSRRAHSFGRRAVAALSWAYASGLVLAAGLAAGVVLIPPVQHGAASALTWVSGKGLEAGIRFMGVTSNVLVWAQESTQSVLSHLVWLETIGRAMSSVGASTEVRIAILMAAVVTAILYPTLIAGRLQRRNSNPEGPHVGTLLA